MQKFRSIISSQELCADDFNRILLESQSNRILSEWLGNFNWLLLYFIMGFLNIQNWISFCILTVLIALLATVEGIPMNSKAAGWMNDKETDEERSYSHLGGSNKFSKPFVSQPPRSSYYSGGNTSNRTLAAILLLTVFGLAATALLVILCSKMTKKENYDTMKGTVY